MGEKNGEIEGVFHSSRGKLSVSVSCACTISEVWASEDRKAL